MTAIEIVNKIYDNNLQDEVFSILSVRLLEEKNRASADNLHHKAILKLINKITKDKTVKEILEDEGR